MDRKILDIQVNFNKNMLNNTVSTVSQKRAVQQYIYNLLDTSTMELPYKEWQGSGLNSLLGEACSNINASIIAEQIKTLITQYVPYVNLYDIKFNIDYDNQKYVFTLIYSIVNEMEVITDQLVISTHN